MGKDKLRKFAAVNAYSHVFEPPILPPDTPLGQQFDQKGKWHEYFKNDNPIILELGCGKGEYTVGLAKHFPDKNFIGMDIKGARIWKGASEAVEQNIKNVAFLRSKIDFLPEYFDKNEISEIWLTFSDPQPKKVNKRLTSPPFIERYRAILKAGGLVHMKTDSDLLYEYTQKQITKHSYQQEVNYPNLYDQIGTEMDSVTKDILHIKTHYEKLFTAKGSVIKYCRFRIG